MTVFLSTHQVSVAEEMADRIGVFHRGRVIACGTAAELRSQSQTSGSLESAFLTLTREDETRAGPAAP
jgi:ABC-2 type transport system ATP-binding protein